MNHLLLLLFSMIGVTSPSMESYLVGNLSQAFTFQVAPPSINVTYLGLNGFSLFIMGVGFSNKSKFNYDEQTNRLTILSLDSTTVGYYSAVDSTWKTFTNILSAINVSSLTIENSHVNEENNGSALVSCSVSIIRSIFQLTEPNLQTRTIGTEHLPRLDLSISTSPILSEKKIFNETLNEQYVTRMITFQRRLTRADHNGTIQCQVESTNNIDIHLIKTVPINIEYGPNLETGALPIVNLESEVLKMIAMECQIEANPNPSYVWYDVLNNFTTGQSVFGTTRAIQRIYQYPGQYSMQCQAQSRGNTIKQEFIITVVNIKSSIKSNIGEHEEKSNKIPVIIGITVGSVLLLLVVAILVAAMIFFKRRKVNSDQKDSLSTEKLSNEKPRWKNLPIDYSKYKNESSSSTSHLVEAAENNSVQVPPPIPARPSPMTSTHSSYRQAPSTSVSLSYRQASALPGFRLPPPVRSYSPERDDDVSTSINPMPLSNNRSKTTTPFGSHRSLSESIQSLRSNQQPVCLPVKKRCNDLPLRSVDTKKDYQHHHYHNPAELMPKTDNTSSEEEEEEEFDQHQQTTNPTSELSTTNNPLSGYNQVNFQGQNAHRILPPSSSTNLPSLSRNECDEVPPSYNNISKTSPSHAYVYQEPTEV